MDKSNYKLFLDAKKFIKSGRTYEAIMILRKINALEPNDCFIKIELARALVRNPITKEEGKRILIQLLNSEFRDRNYAIFELGKLAVLEKNNEEAKYYFSLLLNGNAKDVNYALLELGKLSKDEGNFKLATFYFNRLLNGVNSTIKDKAFATLELGKINASEGNNEQARFYFNQLLTMPQSMTFAMLELGKLEAIDGNYSTSRAYFEKLLTASEKDRACAISELIFLNIKEKKYNDAYSLLNSTSTNLFPYLFYVRLVIYLKYKLGLMVDYDKYSDSYFLSQLFNYDENKTIRQIEKKIDENDKVGTHTSFNSDIDLKELLFIVRNKIQFLNPVSSSLVDKYLVNCDMTIANMAFEDTKYLMVITLPNSKDILTMYPVLVSKDFYSKTTEEGNSKILKPKRIETVVN